MKMIKLRCSILAVIIFIPLISIQHFIEPLSDCLLADICNHTWVPECAEDLNINHKRLFIDECDVYEFNCDNDVKYIVVNYSDCFGPMTCPTLPPHKFLRQGNYLYRADDRRIVYSPTTVKRRTTVPMKTKAGKRRYTPEKAKRRLMKNKKNKIMTTPCAPCMRTKFTTPKPQRKALPKPQKTTKRTNKHIPKHTTRRTTRILTTRITTQVIQTETSGTVVLRRVTVIKNGMVLFKVVKGYMTPAEKEDSDFLE